MGCCCSSCFERKVSDEEEAHENEGRSKSSASVRRGMELQRRNQEKKATSSGKRTSSSRRGGGGLFILPSARQSIRLNSKAAQVSPQPKRNFMQILTDSKGRSASVDARQALELQEGRERESSLRTSSKSSGSSKSGLSAMSAPASTRSRGLDDAKRAHLRRGSKKGSMARSQAFRLDHSEDEESEAKSQTSSHSWDLPRANVRKARRTARRKRRAKK